VKILKKFLYENIFLKINAYLFRNVFFSLAI
jgi:hypothetical protein